MTCMTSRTRVWHGSGWVSSYVKRVLDRKNVDTQLRLESFFLNVFIAQTTENTHRHIVGV